MNALIVAIFACVLALAHGDSPGRVVAIVKQASELNQDASYGWSFESENGISAQEQGHQDTAPGSKEISNSVQGAWAYTAPDNSPVQFKYVADANGFRPESNAIPTPPPIPPAILRSLEWNLAHPEKEESGPARRP